MREFTQHQPPAFDLPPPRPSARATLSPREVAAQSGFRKRSGAADHLHTLRSQRVSSNYGGGARSWNIIAPRLNLRKRLVNIPFLGSIPAGFADDCSQDAGGCVSIDVGTLGIKPTARTFALEVRGDSMIGKHIQHGDIVVLEHGLTPRVGDVVAALIDNESTLKTFVYEKGKAHLRAENPRYPHLIPASELVIQGVMVALIRRRK